MKGEKMNEWKRLIHLTFGLFISGSRNERMRRKKRIKKEIKIATFIFHLKLISELTSKLESFLLSLSFLFLRNWKKKISFSFSFTRVSFLPSSAIILRLWTPKVTSDTIASNVDVKMGRTKRRRRRKRKDRRKSRKMIEWIGRKRK